jgi:DNA helicase-2/ATP-dependent DNA helicase PcrA
VTIPEHIEVWPWFTFLIHELARPYQSYFYDGRIETLTWENGISVRGSRATEVKHYIDQRGGIYSDKVAKFICKCNAMSGGAVINRLAERFDHIIIDEVQDLAAYDLDVLELFLRSPIKITLVGDHRQSTFKTNNSSKYSVYSKFGIIQKFKEWEDAGIALLKYETETHRCIQAIATLGDSFYPTEPKTRSLNEQRTGHDGVFLVSTPHVVGYVERYQPNILRLKKTDDCQGYNALNFGESKGMTFERVLIFPHKLGQQWLLTGDNKHIAGSIEKIYVGVTRARFSVAFVFNTETPLAGFERYQPPAE